MAPLRREKTRALEEAVVPAAHVVWWRAQIRARAEAHRIAAQPVTFAQAVAVVSRVVVTLTTVPAIITWARNLSIESVLVRDVAASVSAIAEAAGPAGAAPLAVSAVAVGLAACLVLVPVVLYVLLADD